MNICNMYDRTKEIDKLIKIFKNNKDFYIFYDEEKDDYFLRKNKKNYTGKYEKIENSIDSDFYSHNFLLIFIKKVVFMKMEKEKEFLSMNFLIVI